MNEIKVFSNSQFGDIRVKLDENGNPLFCLKDLCDSLDLSNATVVSQRLDTEEVTKLDLGGRIGITNFVTEPGMYTVILRSDSPKAKPMQKWVTGEVLPSIRKHGAYMTSDTIEKALTSPDFLIQLATNLKDEQQKRIALEKTVENQKPAVLFKESVTASNTAILMRDLAKILNQNGIEIGEVRLYDWMVSNGYLIRKQRWSTKRQTYENDYMPTQRAADLKVFFVTESTITTGETGFIKHTVKVTGKGQVYFVNKFLSNNPKALML